MIGGTAVRIVSRETSAARRLTAKGMFHVKHLPPAELATLLTERAAALGLSLPPDRLASLAEALAWLGPAAYQIGLTNYATLPEFVTNLVAPVFPLLTPSLAPVLLSPTLDFGAGSGAVGLSLAILQPDLQVVLADRRVRVLQFIDLALSRLRISNGRTLRIDLADPPADWQAACGTVLIRAFGPTETALAHASRLTRPDGTIALWHQPPPPPPPAPLRQAETLPTGVPALALTIYRPTG